MPFKLENIENDSYAPIIMEIVLRTPDGLVEIPSHDYFQSLQIENAVDEVWTGTLTLFDPDDDFLENLILYTGLQGTGGGVLLRWNWDTPTSGGLVAAPLFEAEIIDYHPEFTAEGVAMALDLVGAAGLVPVIDRRTRSFPAGTKISDIFREIAEDRGWVLESGGAFDR